jgi:protein TonB
MDLNACKPAYPRAAVMSEEQGTVRVQFTIGAAGQLVAARVLKSSGYRNLDDAAVKGLSRCKFRPAYQNGNPVQSSFVSDYVWSLNDASG